MPTGDDKRLAVIFGGNGFVGKHLTSALLKNGYQVHIADLASNQQPRDSFTECDVREEIKLKFEKAPDLVINLAAVHRTPGHEIDEYYETNVGGAINVVNWCISVGAERLIFTSSIAVYGPNSQAKDEHSSLNPIHAYGKSKLLAENIYRLWQSENPSTRNLIICRPAVIFGPGENGNLHEWLELSVVGYSLFLDLKML